MVRQTIQPRWQSAQFRRRPRRARRSIVAEAESSQSDSALDGSRGPRGSAVRFEPTGCLRRQRGREGTQPSGATRRLEPVGRQTSGAAVRPARNEPCSRRRGQSPVSDFADAEWSVCSTAERKRNVASAKVGVWRQGGQPVPRVGSNKLAGLAGGAASRSGEPSIGARGPRLSPVVQARIVRQQPGDSIILTRCSPRAHSASHS